MIKTNYHCFVDFGSYGCPNSGTIESIDTDECYVFAPGECSEKIANQLAIKDRNLYSFKTRMPGSNRPLSLKELREEVKKLVEHAKANPTMHYIVPTLAYGVAGYNETDIAPLFKEAYGVYNIHLPFVYLNRIFLDHVSAN